MTAEYTPTRHDTELAEATFAERNAQSGRCFACGQPCVRLMKKFSTPAMIFTMRADPRLPYFACVNPDCFMQTDVGSLETWEAVVQG